MQKIQRNFLEPKQNDTYEVYTYYEKKSKTRGQTSIPNKVKLIKQTYRNKLIKTLILPKNM